MPEEKVKSFGDGMFPDGIDVTNDEIAQAEASAEHEEVEPQEQATETETETVEASTETETETAEEEPKFDFEGYYRELGLDKTFPDPRKALEAIPNQNKYIGELERRTREQQAYIQQMLQQAQQQPKPEPQPFVIDPEKFYENPTGMLTEWAKSQGLINRSEFETAVNEKVDLTLQQRDVEDFIKQTPDFEDYRPRIQQLLYENPAIEKIAGGPHKALRSLYTLAKSEKIAAEPQETKVVVQPTNPKDKPRAETTGGKPGGSTKPKGKADAHGLTPEDYANLPLDEIERRVGYSG
jgi:hypothetical protein